MPSGLRVDTEAWVTEHEEAKQLAQEIVTLIQERNINHSSGGPEASRKTAAARRKIGTLGTTLDKLLRWLDTEEASSLSESEKNRRRDLVLGLKNRREQMQYAIKRGVTASERDQLFTGMPGSSKAAEPKETEATAELDARGLLQLQNQVMKSQDTELEAMEKSIQSTKHIALAIGEETDLQTRLLDDLEDDVEVTNMRTRAATSRVRQIIKNSSNWRSGLCVFLLIVALVLVLVLALKLHRLITG
uniref:t-SNARE coiled-coil homology domain-containing protein n=1 Tax=Chlamydomonas euryale TaxID=1486919 RepID=A0A7R9W0C5_9CHLO|mmetsp:Transcript_9239/g.28115  ORF Transcript_9239/g.28115 Transcript_9239/m.28115 type:complete len:246 (+) Transcript_9239:375-1112(+)